MEELLKMQSDLVENSYYRIVGKYDAQLASAPERDRPRVAMHLATAAALNAMAALQASQKALYASEEGGPVSVAAGAADALFDAMWEAQGELDALALALSLTWAQKRHEEGHILGGPVMWPPEEVPVLPAVDDHAGSQPIIARLDRGPFVGALTQLEIATRLERIGKGAVVGAGHFVAHQVSVDVAHAEPMLLRAAFSVGLEDATKLRDLLTELIDKAHEASSPHGR